MDSPFCRPHLHLNSSLHHDRTSFVYLALKLTVIRQVFHRINLSLSNSSRGCIHATVNREMQKLSWRLICQRQFRVKCIKNRIAAARSMNELCKMWSNIDASASLAFIDTAEMAWPTVKTVPYCLYSLKLVTNNVFAITILIFTCFKWLKISLLYSTIYSMTILCGFKF